MCWLKITHASPGIISWSWGVMPVLGKRGK